MANRPSETQTRASQQPLSHFFRSRLGSRFLLAFSISALFVLDQWVKSMVVQHMILGESIPLWPQVFHLTYLKNTGAAFSLLSAHPQLLTLVTAVFFIGFSLYAFTRQHFTRWEYSIFSLVLGGALGNLWDRLTRGHVVDYLDVTLIHYPVFNLADAFIFCGMTLLLIQTLKIQTRKPTRTTKASSDK